jgi:peptide/nickel transport system permease protein
VIHAGAVVALVFVVGFVLLQALPGDPADRLENPAVPAEQAGRDRSARGLDRSLPEQLLRTLTSYAQGDFGVSHSRSRPVADVLTEAVPYSAGLGAAALLVAYGLGIPAGLAFLSLAPAARDGLDRLALLVSVVPRFWLGVLLVLVFHTCLGWLPPSHAFPPGQAESGLRLSHLLLPALALGLPAAAVVARATLATLGRVTAAPHVRRARAAGSTGAALLFRHVLPVGAAPLLALLALDLPALVSGSLVVETVFAWPGAGRISAEAVIASDYPLALACVALSGLTIVGSRAAGEALARRVDPRSGRRA